MKRKRVNQSPRQTLLIVTATEAESLYFSQMRKDCRYTNMSVLWAQHAGTLEDLIRTAAVARTKGRFNFAWCVFGFADLGVNAAQVVQAQEFAAGKKIQLAWNNPGISLWYLLHIQSPRLPVGDPKIIESTLRGHLPGFSQSAAYLLTAGSSLHLRLFSAKAQAVVNAGSYNQLVQQRTGGLPATNMAKLLTEISDLCGIADISHNQKLIGMKNT